MIQDCEIPYCGKLRGESHGESIQGYTAQHDFQRPVTACCMNHWVWLQKIRSSSKPTVLFETGPG